LNYPKEKVRGKAAKLKVAGATDINVYYLADPAILRALAKRQLETTGERMSRNRFPTALVIDEINRADLSRVFGDLITLLESDKREGMAEATSVYLPYSQTLFSVPPELTVIGTMNTTDRSLAVIDYSAGFELVKKETCRHWGQEVTDQGYELKFADGG
jgi:hypothetical protein